MGEYNHQLGAHTLDTFQFQWLCMTRSALRGTSWSQRRLERPSLAGCPTSLVCVCVFLSLGGLNLVQLG